MSMETLDTLWTQWQTEELEMAEALGPMLQHLKRLDADNQTIQLNQRKQTNALTAVNITLANLRDDLDALIAHIKDSP